jgi:hypothetical protein
MKPARSERAEDDAFLPEAGEVVVELEDGRAAATGDPRFHAVDEAGQQRREEEPHGETKNNFENRDHGVSPK